MGPSYLTPSSGEDVSLGSDRETLPQVATSPISLSQVGVVDKGKRKLVDAWEDSPRIKKVCSPVGV